MTTERNKNKAIDALVSELLKEVNPAELFGKNGVFAELKSRIVNKALEAEMEEGIEMVILSHKSYQKESGNLLGLTIKLYPYMQGV